MALTFVAACSGCGNTNPPSPYSRNQHDRPNPLHLTLPTVIASYDRFKASEIDAITDIKSGRPIDVKALFSSDEEASVPPVILFSWKRLESGGRRRFVQQHAGDVVRKGTNGTAMIETFAPTVPGKYEIEIRCPLADSDRAIGFPVLIVR